MISIDEAVLQWRADPRMADLVRDAYMDRDVAASTKRFFESAEFTQMLRIIGGKIQGATILDLGAGTGIASYAFIQSGAAKVYAVEPDPSDEVGRGAIQRWCDGMPIEIINSFAENLPLPAQSIDIYYGRQVLHHISNLPAAMQEAKRVLKPGGLLIACREHVVDDEYQLAFFLKNHPMHQLAGGENAYALDEYVSAIQSGGLHLKQTIGPLESVINAFPQARNDEELRQIKRMLLQKKLGLFGILLNEIPVINRLIWNLRKPIPGRMYTFIAEKPL